MLDAQVSSAGSQMGHERRKWLDIVTTCITWDTITEIAYGAFI